MKKISQLLKFYILIFWMAGFVLAIYAGENLSGSWYCLGAIVISSLLIALGCLGALAYGPQKEMEERDENRRKN